MAHEWRACYVALKQRRFVMSTQIQNIKELLNFVNESNEELMSVSVSELIICLRTLQHVIKTLNEFSECSFAGSNIGNSVIGGSVDDAATELHEQAQIIAAAIMSKTGCAKTLIEY